MFICSFPIKVKSEQQWCPVCRRWTDKAGECERAGRAADIAAGKLVRSSAIHVSLGWVSE